MINNYIEKVKAILRIINNSIKRWNKYEYTIIKIYLKLIPDDIVTI